MNGLDILTTVVHEIKLDLIYKILLRLLRLKFKLFEQGSVIQSSVSLTKKVGKKYKIFDKKHVLL